MKFQRGLTANMFEDIARHMKSLVELKIYCFEIFVGMKHVDELLLPLRILPNLQTFYCCYHLNLTQEKLDSLNLAPNVELQKECWFLAL